VLARGTSDENGHVALTAPADLPGLVLIAGGPRCVAAEQHDVVLPVGGAETTMRVTAAAEVRGVVTPLAVVERFGPTADEIADVAEIERTQWVDPGDLAARHARIELRPVGGERGRELGTHVAANGSFVIGGVSAGRYEVWIAPTIAGSRTPIGPLDVLWIDPAQPARPLTVHVPHLMPARGTVRLLLDGEPAHGSGGLARLIENGVSPVGFALGAGGVATTPWLLPGSYVPFVVVGDAQVFGEERIEVTADGLVDATFSLQRRQVTLTVFEPAGEPARDVVVLAEAIDRPELGRTSSLCGRTGVEGTIVLDAVPRGRLRVRAFARDQDPRDGLGEPALLLGDVAADANAATLRLPR